MVEAHRWRDGEGHAMTTDIWKFRNYCNTKFVENEGKRIEEEVDVMKIMGIL